MRFLQIGLLLFTVQLSYAQLETINLNDYYLPDLKRNVLVVDFGLSALSLDNNPSFGDESSERSFSFRPSIRYSDFLSNVAKQSRKNYSFSTSYVYNDQSGNQDIKRKSLI